MFSVKSSLSIIVVTYIHKQAYKSLAKCEIFSVQDTKYAMTVIIVIFRDLLERVDQLEKLDLKDYK